MDTLNQPAQFLTSDESSLVDGALLASSDKFLTRLTISSLRLLTRIAKDNQTSIEELTVPMIIQWFERDAKIRLEQGPQAAQLKW